MLSACVAVVLILFAVPGQLRAVAANGGSYSCKVARTLREPCGHPVNVTEHKCQAYGCCWDPTHDELEGKAHCFRREVVSNDFKPNEYLGHARFCPNGKYFLGDVNADGYADQFCFTTNDGMLKISLGSMISPYREEKQVVLAQCMSKFTRMEVGNGFSMVDTIKF